MRSCHTENVVTSCILCELTASLCSVRICCCAVCERLAYHCAPAPGKGGTPRPGYPPPTPWPQATIGCQCSPVSQHYRSSSSSSSPSPVWTNSHKPYGVTVTIAGHAKGRAHGGCLFNLRGNSYSNQFGHLVGGGGTVCVCMCVCVCVELRCARLFAIVCVCVCWGGCAIKVGQRGGQGGSLYIYLRMIAPQC